MASECPSTLGPKGYGYVQVSPPQEHVRGNQWWLAYQPVSYRIESRKGTRAQFQSMVNTCHAAGVKVHRRRRHQPHVRPGNGGTGWAGSSYGHYDYPGIYQPQDFHHCGRNGNDDIVNYNDRYEVQNCELVNLVRPEDRVGVRPYQDRRRTSTTCSRSAWTASGWTPASTCRPPTSPRSRASCPARRTSCRRSSTAPASRSSRPSTPATVTCTSSAYGKDLARVFRSERLAYLQQLRRGLGATCPASRPSVFVDNHDTQRDGGGVLTYRDRGIYALANAFMLAWPYGSPTVMSSYTFSNRDAGPPSDGGNKTLNTTCYSGWECEHRWPVIANMVGFRNATEGAGGRQLVRQRQQPHRVQPQRQGLRHHQRRGLGGERPLVLHRAARRSLLRRHPRHVLAAARAADR